MIDLFEELRAVELDGRLVTGRRGLLAPATLLAAGTTAGAAALGWGHTVWWSARGPTSSRSTSTRSGWPAPGPPTPPRRSCYAAAAADVTDVVVAGRRIVEGGEHLLVDDVGGHLARATAAVTHGGERR